MGTIGWVAVGVTAWVALSVPLALVVGALLRPRAVPRRAPRLRTPRRDAAWLRHGAPCVRRVVTGPAA